jgi:Asp-tRNA(Asn)/Glu-tRNA(Gln) amidotransferase B subunit
VEDAVRMVLSENKKAIVDYQNGKGQVIGYLIGQVQKKLMGKGEIKTVNEELVKQINGR